MGHMLAGATSLFSGERESNLSPFAIRFPSRPSNAILESNWLTYTLEFQVEKLSLTTENEHPQDSVHSAGIFFPNSMACLNCKEKALKENDNG